ncbi:PREDICTED: UBX domain-containing protein 4 [Drosophila arizonae]|uniref:UBX domain-containing protein 4 n=1 Tax=Drosophila arizonae TaxID=7263 RepID=A0ABM1P5F1_DROAR|nr:PREDICTED: UBX domain-containing protein 4 [Drosophila arizonae]
MNWHTGNIAEAVAESKAKDAIFVVYIQGQNEMTANLDRYLDDPRVTEKLQTQDFVAVKIQGDSASYAQFISLYKVVPVPSIFFIGKSGTPLDIATGIVSGVDELLIKINKVLLLSGKQKVNAPTTSATAKDAQGEQSRRKIAGDDSDPSDNTLVAPVPLAQKSVPAAEAVEPVPEPAAEEESETTDKSNMTSDKQAEELNNDPGAAMSSQSAAAKQKSETEMKVTQPLKHAPAAQKEVQEEPQTKKSVAGLSKSSKKLQQPAAANQETARESTKELAESSAKQQSETVSKPVEAAAAEPSAQLEATSSPKPAEPTAAALSAAAAAEKRAAAAAAAAAAAEGEAATSAAADTMATEITSTAVPGPGSPLTPTEETALRATINVQQQVEKRKKERSDEKKRRDKDGELRRRREGREAQEQQQAAREQEFKSMQERIRRERQQEQATRERILAQIAADRAEMANRAAMAAAEVPVTAAPSPAVTATATITPEQSHHSTVEETRLQIRLPGGLIRIKDFPAIEPLATVRNYVREELLASSNIREFTLATSYPRREFKTEDELKSLNDLNLVPNAVLLVLGSSQVNVVVRSRNNMMNILTSVLWAILTPAAVAFDYINKYGFQRLRVNFMQMISNIGWRRRQEVQAPPAAQVGDIGSRRNMDMFMLRTTSAPGLQRANPQNAVGGPDHQIKPTELSNNGAAQAQDLAQQRSGIFKSTPFGQTNIRRLADTAKDDDEDKATYNGNSTQQQ